LLILGMIILHGLTTMNPGIFNNLSFRIHILRE
jgi:hypothetical protein